MNRQNRRHAFLRDTINGIVEHKQFPRILREVVLSVVVEQERIKTLGIIKSFLELCRDNDCGIHLSEDSKVIFYRPDNLTAELRALLAIYRRDIGEHLQMMGAYSNGKERAARANGSGSAASANGSGPAASKQT